FILLLVAQGAEAEQFVSLDPPPTDSSDDASVAEYRPRHVLRNLLVVLDLAFVVSEDAARDVSDGSPSPILYQRHQHDGLVGGRHLHDVGDEGLEMVEEHLVPVPVTAFWRLSAR